MKKALLLAGNLFMIFLIYSCQKSDLRPQEESLTADIPSTDESAAQRGMSNTNCGYVQALSKSISDEGDQELPLFTKEYENGKLKKITVHMRNIAGGGYQPVVLTVTHQWRKMIFTDEATGDMVATLEFNHQNRLTKALANYPLLHSTAFEAPYRFIYKNGKISEVQQMVPEESTPTWYPYLRLAYDHTGNNVSRLSMGSSANIIYEYDYTLKPKEQYYPDESFGDSFYFWYFLQYLDLFPEVTPKNILKRSIYRDAPDGYPAKYERKYSDQQFDDADRLIYYKQSPKWDDNPQAVETWKLVWDCN
jgi:hypothetical protein